MARLFFALKPAEDAATALGVLAQATAAAVGGRPVPRENIHLTLAFLGEIDAAGEAAARGVADRIRGTPFQLRLDELGAFRRARVAWIGLAEPPPALMALQSDLELGLREAAFALEERPFRPHATLARKVDRPAPRSRVEPIGWRVDEFVLMRSEAGAGRYATVAAWALRGAGEGEGEGKLGSPPARG